MDRLRSYRDGVAIVTGGASGIGLALSRALASRGARVVLADRQGEEARRRAAELETTGAAASALEIDVTDPEAVARLVSATVEEHGRLDYLFNNAGVGVGGGVDHHGLDDWSHVLDVNVRGVVHGIQAAYPVFRRQGFGHLVNTASMAGLLPSPLATSYCASKHAVVGLSTSLRIEAAPFGVRVSVLCPGVIRTPILTGGRYGRVLVPLTEAEQLAAWAPTRPMAPDRFAARVLRHVARNRSIIIVPGWWRVFWWIHRASPPLWAAITAVSYRSLRRRFDVADERGRGSGAPGPRVPQPSEARLVERDGLLVVSGTDLPVDVDHRDLREERLERLGEPE